LHLRRLETVHKLLETEVKQMRFLCRSEVAALVHGVNLQRSKTTAQQAGRRDQHARTVDCTVRTRCRAEVVHHHTRRGEMTNYEGMFFGGEVPQHKNFSETVHVQ
jgi:hypothetical protein